MTTVAARVLASTPARHADATWAAIVDLLTRGAYGAKRDELLAVAGTAASLVADRAMEEEPIVVTCDGPRTRIRCVYDDDAVDDAGVNENPLGFDPLAGDWSVSLPCSAGDLAWVRASLARHSTRIVARGPDEAVAAADRAALSGGFDLDVGAFLR